jgi:hypothetical protein
MQKRSQSDVKEQNFFHLKHRRDAQLKTDMGGVSECDKRSSLFFFLLRECVLNKFHFHSAYRFRKMFISLPLLHFFRFNNGAHYSPRLFCHFPRSRLHYRYRCLCCLMLICLLSLLTMSSILISANRPNETQMMSIIAIFTLPLRLVCLTRERRRKRNANFPHEYFIFFAFRAGVD